MPRRLGLALFILLATGLPAPATAQLLQDDITVVIPSEPPLSSARSVFARDAQVAVLDRMIPAFSARGITVGNFDVYPALVVGSLFTSNVFANDDRRRADLALVVRPELTVRTSGGPYQIAAYARGDVRRYAGHSSENTEEALGGVRGLVAIGPLSSLSAGANYGSLISPRYSADTPVDAAKPLEYNLFTAYAGGIVEQASTRVIVRADVTSLRYRDTPRTGGGRLFTRDRDRARYEGLVRLERSISPAASFYGAATVNRIDYRLTPASGIPRDSRGYGLYVGANFEASTLLRGDIRVGYIRQNFKGGLRPVSGIGALGTLIYFPSRIMTVTVRGESTVEDSGVPGSGGFTHRGGSVNADYELRRYLIASMKAGYFKDRYRGLARRDSLPFAEAAVTYVSQGHMNARLGYRFLSRNSTETSGATDFNDHRVMATLTFQN